MNSPSLTQPFRQLLILAAAITAAAFVLASPAAAQGNAQRARTMSVEDLTRSLAPTPRLPFRTFVGLRQNEYWPTYVPDRQDHECIIESDELHEFLMEADHTLQQDGTELRIDNGRVLMHGTAEQVQTISDLIRVARDQLAAPITIDAAIIRHDGELSPPSVLDADQARAMFEGHEANWRGIATTPQRMATFVGTHRAVSYVHTNHAHIAEERWEAQPVHEELFDGVGMVAVAHRMAAGTDLILQTQFAIGKLEQLVACNTGLRDQPDIQRPSIRTTAASMSGRIKNGGALVFNAKASERHGGNVLVILRASWTPSQAKVPENLKILPVSSLTTPGCGLPRLFNSDHVALANAEDDNLHDDGEPQEPLIEADMLAEHVMMSVHPDAWDDTAQMNMHRGHMIVHGKPELLKKVTAFLTAEERQLLHTLEVSYAFGEGRITLPTLAGRNHAVRHGVETTAVTHAELEIAKKASIQTPVVVRLFDGIEIAVRPYAYDQGLGAHIDWLARRIEGEPKGTNLPPIHMSTRNHSGPVPSNGLQAGDGPLGKQTWHVRMH